MNSEGTQPKDLRHDSGSPCVISPWYGSAWKKAFDLLAATLLLIGLMPVMVVVALLVKLTSPGPVLFRQRRPGKDGREFSIFKFRTMIDGGHRAGPAFTRPSDPRVTPLGAFIRKWKLDEFPQLFNVLRGEMSFVGPRPLPTSHWEQATIEKDAACVLSVRPGITSQVTLTFRNEEQLLAEVSSGQVGQLYLNGIMPLKLKMEAEALRHGSLSNDLRIMLQTALFVFSRQEKKDDVLIRERLLHERRETHPPAAEVRQQESYQPAAEQAD